MHDNIPAPLGDGRDELETFTPGAASARAFGMGQERPPAGGGGGAQIQRIVGAVFRYKWLLAVCAVIGLGAGYILRGFSAPTYSAEATVWIQVPNERESSRGPIRSGNLLEVNGWVDLLRSFTVLDHVVLSQRLYLSGSLGDRSTLEAFSLADRFRPGAYRIVVDESGQRYQLFDGQTDMLIESGANGDSIGRGLGFRWAPRIPAGRELNFTLTTPREAARRLNEGLVTQMRQTQRQEQNFIRLQLEGGDPNAVANVVNAIADRFVEVGSELKRSQLAELVQILETQRLYAERNLRDAEIALENFRVNTITLPQDNASPVAPGLEATTDPVMDNYFELKIQREQLRRDEEGVQRALALAGEGGAKAANALAALPSATQSPELTAAITDLNTKRAQLRSLQQQYTSEHPLVQRLTADIQTTETETLPKLGRDLLAQLQTRAGILDGWIGSASTDLEKIPPRMIEEARLRRNVEVAERLHTNLRERYEEARLATASVIPDVRVLDRAASPEGPVANRGLQFLALGLFGGLGLGIALAILLDRFDGRVRYPDQVTRQLGLPILGALPQVKTGAKGAAANATSQAIEALREIRLNILHSVEKQHPLVLAVTSPGSGDGKTFISCNLALACAGAGQRTLIIDGDTRRGELHRMLNATRSPGLTDYLKGDVQMNGIVQQTDFAGLDFIGSGTRQESSPNLLGGQAMEELLRAMYRNYDVVLIDCPPLAAGVDPYLIGTLVGNVMMVLRTGRTDRSLAEAKLQVLDRLPVRLIGAVLNDVKATGVYRYYSYLSGYEAPPDEVVQSRQLTGV
jgi:polysaccharide biosynthesis transport protein